MGCTCKKKVNSKYLDTEEQEEKKLNGLQKVLMVIGQFLFGILITCIIVIGLVPFLIIVMIHVCTGKKLSFRIPDLTKLLQKAK